MGCNFMEAIVYYFIIYSFIYIFRSEMAGKRLIVYLSIYFE